MTTTGITPEQLAKNRRLLDVVKELLRLKNDAALSRALGVMPAVISKIRHGHLPVGPYLLIRIHELTGMLFKDIRVFVPKTA